MIVGTTAHSRSAWAPQLGVVDVMGRSPPQLGAEERHRGAQDLERGAPARHLRQQRRQPGRKGPEARHLRREPARLAGVGELALEQQVPDVFERSPRREVDGRVLAVVEEALLAPDVAHRRSPPPRRPRARRGSRSRARPRGAGAPRP